MRTRNRTAAPDAAERRFPRYGLAGALVTAVSETGMLLRIEPFWSWHTPIAWTGYILFVDAWVWKRRGTSWLMDARAEFALLAAASVPLWLVFEWYNKYFLHNWYYVNLPDNPALRYLGYVWSFATIWPAIFETGDLIATFRKPGAPAAASPSTLPPSTLTPSAFGIQPPSPAGLRRPGHWALFLCGLALLLWPILWPSPFLAAPVWLGFIVLLDPVNDRFGGESLLGDLRRGTRGRVFNLALAGLICGIVWEFWNYWARTRWIYAVPILPELRIFEMPVLGYGGFPPFALECFTMYVTLRLIFWRGAARPISV